MSVNFPECPPSLKQIQHYLKTASEHDGRDPVVAYWCRLHGLQVGLKLSSKKTPEETKLLIALMEWLEEQKKHLHDNEAITNDVAAQAYLENYALKLFTYADKQDRDGNFGKNVVKAFYTSGMIYDVMATFGELTDEVIQNRKYAKWKAAYIHNCLKNGETPVPGPMVNEEDSEENNEQANEEENENPKEEPKESNIAEPQPSEESGGENNFNVGFNSSFPGLPAANVFPSVPQTPDTNPGGFQPYNPPPAPMVSIPQGPVNLTPEQMTKAQKYCKWAGSALNYDDVQTAITNLNNALQLLQTGIDPA